jgi:hypothetical protein
MLTVYQEGEMGVIRQLAANLSIFRLADNATGTQKFRCSTSGAFNGSIREI